MSVNLNAELERFNRFVSEKIGTGQGDLSPEEALDLWRAENPAEDERKATIRAVEEALEELQTKCASDVARVLSGEKAIYPISA